MTLKLYVKETFTAGMTLSPGGDHFGGKYTIPSQM